MGTELMKQTYDCHRVSGPVVDRIMESEQFLFLSALTHLPAVAQAFLRDIKPTHKRYKHTHLVGIS